MKTGEENTEREEKGMNGEKYESCAEKRENKRGRQGEEREGQGVAGSRRMKAGEQNTKGRREWGAE